MARRDATAGPCALLSSDATSPPDAHIDASMIEVRPNCIYINGRFLQQPATGVQRYARELLKTWDRMLVSGEIDQQDIEFHVLAPRGPIDVPRLERTVIRQVGRLRGHLWTQIELPFFARGGLLFSPGNIHPFVSLGRLNGVVTVHDLAYATHPESYSRAFRLLCSLLVPAALRHADAVIAVSDTERANILARHPSVRGRIYTVHHGAPRWNSTGVAVTESPEPLRARPFVLWVGTLIARKNPQGAIDAVSLVNRQTPLDLVVVGASENGLHGAALRIPPELRDRIHFLGRVAGFSRLRRLYETSVALVFPSFCEGFGIPPLEAMQLGCPVVVSDIPALREVCADAALYFNPRQPQEIAEKICTLMSDTALCHELRWRGRLRASLFTWDECARQTLAVLSAVLHGEATTPWRAEAADARPDRRRLQSEPTSDAPGRAPVILRAADRYAGIPLVAGLAAIHSSRPAPSVPERIGLLNTAAIGDTILMGAIALDLRAAYPGAAIIVFAGPSNYEAACLLDGPTRVETIPIGNIPMAVRKLRGQKLDVLVDVGPWARLNAILALLARAKSTVGFRTPGQHRHFGYDVVVDHRDDVHELENHRSLIRALGIAPSHLPAIRGAVLADPPVPSQANFVAFHLWAGGRNARLREWPTDRWADLATHLVGEGYMIVLTGARSQRSLNEVVISRAPAPTRKSMRNVAGLPLASTAALLAHARLAVSVNTGVCHLAAALGTPLVVLHGPTSVRRWGPMSDAAISIESPLEGCPYLNLGFEGRPCPPKCMEAIEYRVVLEACHRALAYRAPTPHPHGAPAEVSLATG